MSILSQYFSLPPTPFGEGDAPPIAWKESIKKYQEIFKERAYPCYFLISNSEQDFAYADISGINILNSAAIDWENYSETTKSFILFHEAGHVFHNHVGRRKMVANALAISICSFAFFSLFCCIKHGMHPIIFLSVSLIVNSGSCLAYSWYMRSQEYEADRFAQDYLQLSDQELSIVFRSISDISKKWACRNSGCISIEPKPAIHLDALTCLEICDQIESKFLRLFSSHPSYYQRIINLFPQTTTKLPSSIDI